MRRVLVLSMMTALLSAACDDGGGGTAPADGVADASADAAPDGEVADDALAPLPEPELWSEGPDFAPSGDFVEAHPTAFERISRWVTHEVGPPAEGTDLAERVARRGGYGTGNGWTFGLVGMAEPLNTLHGLTGPTYERRPYFFGDYGIGLAPVEAEDTPHFDEQWAAWSLSAPMIMTRGTLGSLRLDTVDFAPATDDEVLRACFVRVLTVTNDGDAASEPHELRVRATNSVERPEPEILVEVGDERTLTTGLTDGSGGGEGRVLVVDLGSLEPGGTWTGTLVHCSAEGADPTPIPELDAGALLDQTAADYAAWAEGLVQVDLPDPMVADFVDGMKMGLRVQTAATGANCPMSMYTRTWGRDNIGPVLGFLAVGAQDMVAGMMDYVYGAVLHEGDLRNSYVADLDLSDLPSPPDWESLGPLATRVASETPSYMTWIYGAWYRHTGRTARAEERWGFLRRAMLDQAFGEDGMLPFTGDETFRAAMNGTFGYELESPHHEESWSANSSLLWLGAHGHFEALGARLGHTDDVAAAAARFEEAEAGFFDHFLLDDGCVAALRDRETGETVPAPFEDVSTKLTWAGYQGGDEALARENVACLLDRLRWKGEAGRMQSPIHEKHADHPLLPPVEGVYTGMLPGYVLSALTSVGHPEAEDAFDVLGDALGTSGHLQEYQVADDHRGFTLNYDATGKFTDYTAKLRPWEGGIALAAALEYLVGFRPDHPERTATLRPHLPNDWPSMAFEGLRAGDARFDLEVERLRGGGAEVRVTSRAEETWDVEVRWDVPSDGAIEASLDGEPVDAGDLERFDAFGRGSIRVGAVTLAPGETRAWSFR